MLNDISNTVNDALKNIYMLSGTILKDSMFDNFDSVLYEDSSYSVYLNNEFKTAIRNIVDQFASLEARYYSSMYSKITNTGANQFIFQIARLTYLAALLPWKNYIEPLIKHLPWK